MFLVLMCARFERLQTPAGETESSVQGGNTSCVSVSSIKMQLSCK